MNKEDYKTLEEIKRLDDTLLNEIKRKETGIKILEPKITCIDDVEIWSSKYSKVKVQH